jgi:hypothetical protein
MLQTFHSGVLALVSMILAMISLFLSVLGLFLESYLLCFFVGAFLGFCDCFSNSIIQHIFTQEYPNQKQIFCLFRLVQALTVSIILVISIYVTNQWVFLLINFVLASFTLFFLSVRLKNTVKSHTINTFLTSPPSQIK